MFLLTIMRKSKLTVTILCLKKEIFTWHNVLIPIKSVLNKDQNHYYYTIFLEKCSYQLAKK